MSIIPPQTRASGTPLWLQPVVRHPFEIADDDTKAATPPDSNSQTDDAANGTAQLGMSLTKLIAQLSRQLRDIEQTFMRALQSIARGVESGANEKPAPSDRATQRTRSANVNPYDGLIRRAARKYELDPGLLTAVVRQESGFDPSARSSAGAMGLMQLMPDTARSLGVTDPYDPAQNVEGGARMLRGLIDRYSGRLDLALAAYNAGPNAVAKYGGIPPYAETRSYVSAILGSYRASAIGA